jgi:polar amino acid transport system substrate-binding protein
VECIDLKANLRSILTALVIFIPIELVAQEYTVAECKQLKVAGPDEWNQNSYFDAKNQRHQGLAYALLHKVSESQQIPYEILPNVPWKRILKYAEDGEVDIIVAIYRNVERERYIEFSEPFVTNDVKIYVQKGKEFDYKSFADLTGKKGLWPAGASYGDEFDTFAQKLDLIGKANIDELFLYLARGTVDYVLQDSSRATRYINEKHLTQKIVALPQSLLSVSVRFGYSRKSRCGGLIEKFKTGYQHLFDTGEIAAFQSNHIETH